MKAQSPQEKKLQSEIDKLNEQIKEKDSKIGELKHLLSISEEQCKGMKQDLEEFQKFVRQYEDRFNPESMTITKGVNMLREVMDNIDCLGTKNQVFRNFIGLMVDALRSDMENIKKQKEDADFHYRGIKNAEAEISSFIGRVASGEFGLI